MATWFLWAVDDDPQTARHLTVKFGEPVIRACASGVRRRLWVCPKGFEKEVKPALEEIAKSDLKLEVFMRTKKGKRAGIIIQFNLWKDSSRAASISSSQISKYHHHRLNHR